MAAWIGLVPRQNSTGGKERMGRISKQGDQYLRWLLSFLLIRRKLLQNTALLNRAGSPGVYIWIWL